MSCQFGLNSEELPGKLPSTSSSSRPSKFDLLTGEFEGCEDDRMTRFESVRIKSEPLEQQTEQEAKDQPMNMANHQEEHNESGDQLKLIFSARDQLSTSLTQLSAILQCNRSLPAEEKQRTLEKIKESSLLLMELSPFEATPPADSSWFDQLNFELPRTERPRIFGHLMDIKDALLSDGSITAETKRNLVAQNRQIIDRLLELPCKAQGDVIDGDDSDESFGSGGFGSAEENDSTGEPPSKKKHMVESRLNEELENLKALTRSQAEQLASFEAKMNELRNELKSELRREMKEVETARAETSFKFELPEVSKFFKVDKNEHISDRFWCRSLQWSLVAKAELHPKDGKYLGFFLNCHNEDWSGRSCKVDYQLILLRSRPGEQFAGRGEKIFHKAGAHGFRRFISYRELVDEKKSYVEDNKIQLGIHLKVEPLAGSNSAGSVI